MTAETCGRRRSSSAMRASAPTGTATSADTSSPERAAAAILSRHAGRAISADPVPEQEIAAFHMAAGLGASFSEGIAGMYMALNRDGIPFSGDGAQSLSCETPLETVLAPVVAQPV